MALSARSPMNLKVKAALKQFFDREAVINAIKPAQRKALSNAGAYVRQTARTSIRKSKSTSKPGQPPHSHGEHLLRNKIFFVYDPQSESVVVGPAKLNSGTEAPKIMEHGGQTIVDRKAGQWYRRPNGQWVRADRDLKQRVQIATRPFMGPAVEKNQSVLDDVWKNSITT